MFRSLITGLLVVGFASADCSRASLQAATDRYVAAQASGAGWLNVFPNHTYTENESPVDIRTGVLSVPMKLDHNRSIHDTVACASFTELVAANQENPSVIGTRILYGPGTNGSLWAHTIESIVTKTGDWAFNATGYLRWNALETWDPIPGSKRDSREAIKAAGDAYFDRFNNVNITVPFGVPCDRLEGGAYTGAHDLANNTCDIGGLPSNIKVTNRRYVVDEVMGVVDIFLGFPGLDRSVDKPAPDSHMFRVEGGRIRYIHTVSACYNAGCGMNGTLFGKRSLKGTFPGRRWKNRTSVERGWYKGAALEKKWLNSTAAMEKRSWNDTVVEKRSMNSTSLTNQEHNSTSKRWQNRSVRLTQAPHPNGGWRANLTAETWRA